MLGHPWADSIDSTADPLFGSVGAGYDDVDVAAAKAHGVQVSHSPGAVDGGTATTAIFLILATLRRFMVAEKSARAGEYPFCFHGRIIEIPLIVYVMIQAIGSED